MRNKFEFVEVMVERKCRNNYFFYWEKEDRSVKLAYKSFGLVTYKLQGITCKYKYYLFK